MLPLQNEMMLFTIRILGLRYCDACNTGAFVEQNNQNLIAQFEFGQSTGGEKPVAVKSNI